VRVVVTGGPDFRDRELMHATLDGIKHPITLLIAGDERGAESMALDWAESHAIDFKEFYSDYQGHGPAGFRLRNQRMIERQPDLVIEFPGEGTISSVMKSRVSTDLVRRALRMGIHVIKV